MAIDRMMINDQRKQSEYNVVFDFSDSIDRNWLTFDEALKLNALCNGLPEFVAFRKFTGNWKLQEGQKGFLPYMQEWASEQMRAEVKLSYPFGFNEAVRCFDTQEEIYDYWLHDKSGKLYKDGVIKGFEEVSVRKIYLRGFLYGENAYDLKYVQSDKKFWCHIMCAWLAGVTNGITAEKIALKKLQDNKQLHALGFSFFEADASMEKNDIDLIAKLGDKEIYISVKNAGASFTGDTITVYRHDKKKGKPHIYINEHLDAKWGTRVDKGDLKEYSAVGLFAKVARKVNDNKV